MAIVASYTIVVSLGPGYKKVCPSDHVARAWSSSDYIPASELKTQKPSPDPCFERAGMM